MYTISDNVLTIMNGFNESIDSMIFPDGVTHIIFNDEFNRPIDKVIFPDSVESITFGKSFNQLINNASFPKFLKKIIFGDEYNNSNYITTSGQLDNIIFPDTLQSITFGLKFQKNIEKVIWPKSLESVYFHPKIAGINGYSQPIIKANFMKFIKHLYLPQYYQYQYIDMSNDNLESIVFRNECCDIISNFGEITNGFKKKIKILEQQNTESNNIIKTLSDRIDLLEKKFNASKDNMSGHEKNEDISEHISEHEDVTSVCDSGIFDSDDSEPSYAKKREIEINNQYLENIKYLENVLIEKYKSASNYMQSDENFFTSDFADYISKIHLKKTKAQEIELDRIKSAIIKRKEDAKIKLIESYRQHIQLRKTSNEVNKNMYIDLRPHIGNSVLNISRIPRGTRYSPLDRGLYESIIDKANMHLSIMDAEKKLVDEISKYEQYTKNINFENAFFKNN